MISWFCGMLLFVEVGGVYEDSWLRAGGVETSDVSDATSAKRPRESCNSDAVREDEHDGNVITGVWKTGVCGERDVEIPAGMDGGEVCWRVDVGLGLVHASRTGAGLGTGPGTTRELLISRGRAGTEIRELSFPSTYKPCNTVLTAER